MGLLRNYLYINKIQEVAMNYDIEFVFEKQSELSYLTGL